MKKCQPTFELNDYKPTKTLGEGTFGTVHKWERRWGLFTIAKDPYTRTYIVSKQFKSNANGLSADCLQEIGILQYLKPFAHPNLMKILGTSAANGDPCTPVAVLEYFEGDLSSICSIQKLEFQTAQRIYLELVSGITFLHSQGIMHRDIKPHNILCNDCAHPETCNVKIADMGLATRFFPGNKYHTSVGSLNWLAPEVLLGQEEYNGSIDYWSLGLIFMELVRVHARRFIWGHNELQQLDLIFKLRGSPSSMLWPDARKLPNWKAYKQAYPYTGFTPIPWRTFLSKSGYSEEEVEWCRTTLDAALSLDPKHRQLQAGANIDCTKKRGFTPRAETISYHENRVGIAEYMHELHVDLNLPSRCFQSTMNLFDRYVDLQDVKDIKEMLKTAICCNYIACSIYEQFRRLRIELYWDHVKHVFERPNEIQDMTCNIAHCLEFDFYRPLALDAFEYQMLDEPAPVEVATDQIVIHQPERLNDLSYVEEVNAEK